MDELRELTAARARMYRFLGGLLVMEADAGQLKKLRAMDLSAVTEGDDDMAEGFRLIRQYLDSAGEDCEEDLAAEYARVFLAAGDAAGHAAFPFASVYTDPQHQIGGSIQMQMQALYLARGLEPDPKAYRTMEDHLGLMLEYMANLCDELDAALAGGERECAVSLLNEQRSFAAEYLADWVSEFAADTERCAQLTFYPGVARITAGFIDREQAFLHEAESFL